MRTLFKVSQQTIWQLLGKAATSLTTIVILGSLARSLGAEEVGVLTLALAYLGFFALIADFGLNAHVLPFFLGEGANQQWRKLLGMRIIISLAAVVLSVILLVFYPQSPIFKLTVILGLFGVIQPAIATTATVVFQSKLRFDLSVIASSLGSLLVLGSVMFFIKQGTGNPYLILGYSLGWLLTAVLALTFTRKYIVNLWPVFNLSYAKRIILESWPISVTVILNLVYFRVDAFILSHFRSFAEVGIYNFGYSIFQSLLVVPAFIMNSYYPLMLKDFEEDKQMFLTRLKKASLLMLGAGILGTILTFVFSPLVISIISGGKGFEGSADSLQALSLGFPAFFLSSILMWTLITMRRYKTMLIIYVSGLLLNITLNFIFIPRYSYLAAAYITSVSEYFILILQLIALLPQLRVPGEQKVARS